MRVVGVIPARLQSSRLPRKLLLDRTGKTLIQHTWETARQASSLSELIVATDSLEIADVVKRFGGRAEMTGEHPSGTDRVADLVRRHCPRADIIVNVQGDEPEIDPRQINLLVDTLTRSLAAEMATLSTPIRHKAERDSASCVKVVCTSDGRALYFSRATVPFVRDGNPDELLTKETPWQLHIGLYAYRRDFLMHLTKLPPCELEQLEKLEQLRALEYGATIQVASVEHRAVGIDTPEDYARFVERQRSRAA